MSTRSRPKPVPLSPGRTARPPQSTAPSPPVPLLASAAVGVAAMLLYLGLTPASPGVKDAPEFTLVLGALGVAHPTGYPLYTLAGHAFVLALHSLGFSWAFGANAWSAAGAGVAIFLLHALGCRVPVAGGGPGRGVRFLVALLPCSLFGTNPMWLRDATLAEIHSWHVAWVCGTSLLFLHILREPRTPAPRNPNWALAWGLAVGLGAAHHATSVLVSFALSVTLLLALRGRGRLTPGAFLRFLLGALVPLASYAFLLSRALHPRPADWPLLAPSLAGVLDHVRAAGYQQFLGGWHPSSFQSGYLNAYIFPMLLPAALLWLGAVFQGGAAAERWIRCGLLAAIGVQLLYNFNYGVPDPVDYFLPPLALSLLALPAWLGPALAARRGPALAACLLVAAGALGWGVMGVRAALDTRDAVVGYERTLHGLWASIPDSSGIVLWPDDMFHLLRVYQQLDGEKTRLGVYNPNELPREPARSRFTARYHIDPLRGVDPLNLADSVNRGYYIGDADAALGHAVAAITWNVAQQSSVPVYGFMPQKGAVRFFGPGRRGR